MAEHGQAEKKWPHTAQSGVPLCSQTGKGEAEDGGMGHRVTNRRAKPPIAVKVSWMHGCEMPWERLITSERETRRNVINGSG